MVKMKNETAQKRSVCSANTQKQCRRCWFVFSELRKHSMDRHHQYKRNQTSYTDCIQSHLNWNEMNKIMLISISSTHSQCTGSKTRANLIFHSVRRHQNGYSNTNKFESLLVCKQINREIVEQNISKRQH